MKRLLSLLFLLLLLCSCGEPETSVPETIPVIQPESASVAAENPDHSSVPEGLQDETTQRARQIIENIPYDENNFVSEKDFYAALSEILALHDIQMTPCSDGSAYFAFQYDNITNVRLLTLAIPESEVQKDIEEVIRLYDEKTEALESGDMENAQHRGLIKDIPFDPQRDVWSSDYRVVSFVITGSASPDDQSLFYLVSSAAYAILQPKCEDEKEAFELMKSNVYMLYANNTSDADYVSWIEGIDYTKSLTIPGNAVECWFATKEDQSLWLNITMYIYYDHKTEVLNPT